MKLVYLHPTITEREHVGKLTNDEIAALSDEELADYLRENGCAEGQAADETVN